MKKPQPKQRDPEQQNQARKETTSNEGAGVRPAPLVGKWIAFKTLLGRPVHAGSLAVFRIAVGVVMALEAFSLLRPSASTSGRVMLETYYTGPDIKFNLPYGWFEWLPVLSVPGMQAVVWFLGLGGLLLAVGLFSRAAAVLTFLTWGYLYALESTRTYWMSYYYLELLVLFLLIWMPAGRRYSLDARLTKNPAASQTVPFWTVFLFRAQLMITYFYAGVAKLNADWLLDAVPMRKFLAHPSVALRFEPYLSAAQLDSLKDVLQSDGMAYFLSYAGAVFDVSVGFLLLARRTRLFALILLLFFHATNHFILFTDIVWFPLLGVATATIFLEPGWPGRFWAWLRPQRSSTSPMSISPPLGASAAGRWTVGFVVGWVAWQALFPARHYFIPGDGRLTWEGLSFSWRLKTESYGASPCEITIADPAIVSRDPAGDPRINWAEWQGEKILYRKVTPGQIDWSRMPEIVVLFEPELGERVLYSPLAGPNPSVTEVESRARLSKIWTALYGREPPAVRRTVPLAEILDGYASALKGKGGPVPKSREESLALLLKLHGRAGNGSMIPFLRRMHPFGMENAPAPAVPFLLVEDPALFHTAPSGLPKLDRTAWKTSDATRSPARRIDNAGAEPLLINLAATDFQTRALLPNSFIFDSLSHPEELPAISWDILKDSNLSKVMHISTQPFLLRRYARRVASLWQTEYGRRPAVHALTAVSLNGRPLQRLVDVEADLASVPATHLWHNPWIMDLESPRIPREKRQSAATTRVDDEVTRR